MAQVLLLSPATLGFVAPPGEAHDNGYDDRYLDGSDDGGDEDVMQLLSTGDHVEDVEIGELVALGTSVTWITAAGGEVLCHLAAAVLTELVVIVRTGQGGFAVAFPVQDPVVLHSEYVWLDLNAVIFPSFVLASAHVLDVYLELLQAGRLFDVAGRVVGDAVLTAHRVLVVAIAHDVAHAQHVFRVLVALCSKLAVPTLGHLFPSA